LKFSNNELRPEKLCDIIGQDIVKEKLKICIDSAKTRHEPLPHQLLFGGRGLGKSTFVYAIANEMGCEIQVANGANVSSVKSMLPYLMRITQGSILFIDEIHALRKQTSESLLHVLEDGKFCLGSEDEMIIDIPPFTMIGATTNPGILSTPFLDRFPIKYKLKNYSTGELTQILDKSAQKLNVDMSKANLDSIAQISKNNPRLANNYLTFVRDYHKAKGNINMPDIFRLLDVDSKGLTANDRLYLATLKKLGIAGVNTISASTNIDRETVENVIEPYLLENGFIKKTAKGRELI
jgi:Holliday junction DNA helicase RuvB